MVTLDQTGRPPVRRFATQVGPGRFTVRFTLARTGSGPASIKVSATDRAGRRNAVGPLADGPLSVAEGPASPVHCSGMTVEPSGPVAQAAEVIVTISPLPAPDPSQPVGTGTWVVLPTYEEAENLPG